MTQELILGVLLTGLIGLVWALTVSIWTGDHRASKGQNPEPPSEHADDAQLKNVPSKQHTVMAA